MAHNLYGTQLEKHCPNAQIIYPEQEFQEKVTQGICNIKNINRFAHITDENKPANLFNEVIQELRSKDCDCIILGCTDISVDIDMQFLNSNIPIPIIDSLQVLAQCIIQQAKNEQNIR